MQSLINRAAFYMGIQIDMFGDFSMFLLLFDGAKLHTFHYNFLSTPFMLSLFFSHHSIILLAQKTLTMTDSNSLQITSVNDLPGYYAAAAFTITTKSSEVFKEAEEISPRHVSYKVSYMVSCFIVFDGVKLDICLQM